MKQQQVGYKLHGGLFQLIKKMKKKNKLMYVAAIRSSRFRHPDHLFLALHFVLAFLWPDRIAQRLLGRGLCLRSLYLVPPSQGLKVFLPFRPPFANPLEWIWHHLATEISANPTTELVTSRTDMTNQAKKNMLLFRTFQQAILNHLCSCHNRPSPPSRNQWLPPPCLNHSAETSEVYIFVLKLYLILVHLTSELSGFNPIKLGSIGSLQVTHKKFDFCKSTAPNLFRLSVSAYKSISMLSSFQ